MQEICSCDSLEEIIAKEGAEMFLTKYIKSWYHAKGWVEEIKAKKLNLILTSQDLTGVNGMGKMEIYIYIFFYRDLYQEKLHFPIFALTEKFIRTPKKVQKDKYNGVTLKTLIYYENLTLNTFNR